MTFCFELPSSLEKKMCENNVPVPGHCLFLSRNAQREECNSCFPSRNVLFIIILLFFRVDGTSTLP